MERISGEFKPPRKDALLVAGIVVKGLIILLIIMRFYMLVEEGAGESVATVVAAVLVIIGFIIFTLGLAAGGLTEWMVRYNRFIFRNEPKPGSWQDVFIKLRGRPTLPREKPAEKPVDSFDEKLANLKVPDDFPEGTTMQDLTDWLDYINGRPSQGKKSPYPDVVRFKAIRDWRIMQANGTSVTVNQFLEARFGTASERGLQRVPSSTFYGWWPYFDEELSKFMKDRSKKTKQTQEPKGKNKG